MDAITTKKVKVVLNDGYSFIASNVRRGAYEFENPSNYNVLNIAVNSVDFENGITSEDLVEEIGKRNETNAFDVISIYVDDELVREYDGYKKIIRNGEVIGNTGLFIEIQLFKMNE